MRTLSQFARHLWFSTGYRPLMKLAHRFNWHHMTRFYPEDGRVYVTCSWCGIRDHFPMNDTWEIIAQGAPLPQSSWFCRHCNFPVDHTTGRCLCSTSPSPWDHVSASGWNNMYEYRRK